MLGVVMSGNESEPQSTNEDRLNLEIKWFRRIAFALPFILMAVYFGWFTGYLGWFKYNHISFSTDSGDWGTFGDFIGGFLNPIFALIAFYWLTRSIQLQLHELKETRMAFQASSREQAIAATAQTQLVEQQKRATQAQEDASKAQQKLAGIQAFENLFFELLRQKSDITKDIKASSKTNLVNSAYKFRGFLNEHRIDVSANLNKKVYDMIEDLIGNSFGENTGKESIKRHIIFFKTYSKFGVWQDFYDSCLEESFGSYFRMLYQILKTVDQSGVLNDKISISDANRKFAVLLGFESEGENSEKKEKTTPILKKKYADIFRASLSGYELEAIFFNGLTSRGRPKLKPLIEKYGFFEHMRIDTNRLGEDRYRLVNVAYQYERSAFEESVEWKTYFDEIEKPDPEGLNARIKYGIDESKYQTWKQSQIDAQLKEQDDEAN